MVQSHVWLLQLVFDGQFLDYLLCGPMPLSFGQRTMPASRVERC